MDYLRHLFHEDVAVIADEVTEDTDIYFNFVTIPFRVSANFGLKRDSRKKWPC